MPEWLSALFGLVGIVTSVGLVLWLWLRFIPQKTEAERDAEFARMTEDEKAAELARNVF